MRCACAVGHHAWPRVARACVGRGDVHSAHDRLDAMLDRQRIDERRNPRHVALAYVCRGRHDGVGGGVGGEGQTFVAEGQADDREARWRPVCKGEVGYAVGGAVYRE